MALHAVKRFRLREITSVPAAPSGSAAPTAKFAFKKPAQLLASIPTENFVRNNPFIPHKNSLSGRWAPPKYSLRRQADLIKHARASGTLHLLPPGPKFSAAQLAAGRSVLPETKAEDELKVTAQKEAEDSVWAAPVKWEGKVKERSVAGADVGNRLYAGKKRMFKGHKWERTRDKRMGRTKVMLRDMGKRIVRYKTHHARRRPKPLRPAPASKKAPKLPF